MYSSEDQVGGDNILQLFFWLIKIYDYTNDNDADDDDDLLEGEEDIRISGTWYRNTYYIWCRYLTLILLVVLVGYLIGEAIGY